MRLTRGRGGKYTPVVDIVVTIASKLCVFEL